MRIIKSIEIRKFRSIKSITSDLQVTELNIFVGQNDNGKSNILRALNLFFNNETDVGLPFRFDDDYCYHANSGIGTRREIRIDLLIEPPKHRFKNARLVRWTKKWKRDGSIVQERFFIDNNEPLTSRDNVYKWLDKLKYRYVPAIKGREYFNSLMGELHDVLNGAHSDIMESQGEGFISGIQEITESITNELDRQIGLANSIQVPSDFKLLFSNLDFGSKIGERIYHLKQRGDGIKVRHIPIILKYMADQEKNISIAGYVKPDTIWGFEEPENNLEMKFSFQLAEIFRMYAEDIQIFVTTHSPAFYALDKSETDNVSTFYIQKDENLCTTIEKITHDQNDDLHEKMGFLPLITPYLNKVYEQQKSIEKLEEQIDSLSSKIKCVVLTEDKNSQNLQTLLNANGFKSKETEFFSYGGKDQIKGAFILGRYLKENRPNIVVLVHRDRDYLNELEIDEFKTSFEKNNISFFTTKGVDIESHFLSVQHLKEIFPTISENQIESYLDHATEAAVGDSIGRLYDEKLAKGKPQNNAYGKVIAELQKLYENDKVRYRYGKKVAGVLISNLQRHLKKQVDLFQASKALQIDELQQLSGAIWPR